MGRFSWFLGSFLGLMAISGCGSGRHISSSNERTFENVRIIEHSELRPVLVTVDVPFLSERVTVRDSASHLECRFALSDARINKDGTLFHSLETKEQKLEGKTEVKVEYKDSVVFRDREVQVEVEILVERELNWWQKFRMNGFWVLLGVVIFAYRKYIWKLVKLFLV